MRRTLWTDLNEQEIIALVSVTSWHAGYWYDVFQFYDHTQLQASIKSGNKYMFF